MQLLTFRYAIGTLLAGSALFSSGPALAQSALPDGWIALQSTQPNGENVAFKRVTPPVALMVTIVPNDKVVDFVQQKVRDQEEICPGISSTTMEMLSADAGALIMPVAANGIGCAVGLVGEGPRAAVVTTIGPGHMMPSAFIEDAISIGRIALKTYAAKGSISGNALASSVVAEPKSAAAPIEAKGSAPAGSLQAAIAAIPASHRPIAMVNISQWDSVAMSMMPKPYIIFANGYAVDECDPWDFAQMAPTPEALRSIGSDCSVKRWQKIGNSYRLQDSDGDWSEPGEAGYIRGFKAGERINANHSNRSGTGGYGSSSTWGAALRMTTDGSFSSSQWSGHMVSAPGASGYGSSRGGTSGTYYLDGFIIAVQDESGQISLGTIGRKVESSGTYIYLNGDMMWE